jgi:hypothetical protein
VNVLRCAPIGLPLVSKQTVFVTIKLVHERNLFMNYFFNSYENFVWWSNSLFVRGKSLWCELNVKATGSDTGWSKFSVHLLITIQKVTSNVQSVPHLSPHRQGQENTRPTLKPSIIPNSYYVIKVSDWNCLIYFCVFLYGNNQIRETFWLPCTLHYILFS